ncbi:stage IV sporulation protein [Mesobacillus campisalis]|uniref:Stage IV sporulation protein n=1 Tax=Mesobacillus campisalis TaxID=1408103 RepID=A0A0M2SKN9_9BACI|nr:sporulation protein YqfD [Mesobacillus campisalis]KKK33155.1 stage IV sporulation protein [Mesobacillus campisalis]
MKNQWINLFAGTLRVKVTGKGIERFLNQLTRSGILIWNVKRHGTEAVTFQINVQDAKKLRVPARSSQCKIRFIERAGGPFFLRRIWTNSGFLVGAAAFLIILMFLSNMVWGIEIRGASPAIEHQIRKELADMGVKHGSLQFTIKNVDLLQRDLTDKVKEITWVGVELRGTTYHFQVVEKEEPEKQQAYTPQHLVAAKKATIVKMFVEEGESMVQLNDVVQPGQLLVSGLIGKEEEKKPVPARGEILGETWYKSLVELPLQSTFQVFSGNEARKYQLQLGKLSIPVWGFKKHGYNEFESEESMHQIKFLKWKLPIAFVAKTIREREEVTRTYTKAEAIKSARELARKDIKKIIPEDAKIKGEEILHQSIKNGKVRMSIHFQIIEDIAKGQPIIQGDEE